MPDDLIEKTRAHVEKSLTDESSGHDYWHVYRVWRNAITIGEREGANRRIVELAALLHDISDYKLNGGDHDLGPRLAGEWLASQGVAANDIAHVQEIIHGLDYRGAGEITRMRTIEGRVVHDADKLDAIGAIGIARAFAFGGHRGRPLHDPRIAPVLHASFEQYKAARGTTLNHFSEKLLLLHDRMLTSSGKRMAKERHDYMAAFVERFLREWDGNA